MFDGLAFATSIAYGFGLWATAPQWAGHVEPWDGSNVLYVIAVAFGGLFAAISPRACLAVPVGLVIGQATFMLAILPSGPLAPLGIVFMIISATPSLAVAGALAGGLLLFRRARAVPLRSACLHCGYDLSGVPVGAVCPECGQGRLDRASRNDSLR